MTAPKKTHQEKGGGSYILTALALSYVLLPLLLSLVWRGIMLAGSMAGGEPSTVQASAFGPGFDSLSGADLAGLAAVFLASGLLGLFAGKKLSLPADGYLRYGPLLAPFLLTCLAAIIYFEGAGSAAEPAAALALKFFNAPAAAAWAAPEFGRTPLQPMLLYSAGLFPFLLALHCGSVRRRPLESLRPLSVLGLVAALAGAITCSLWFNTQERLVPENITRMPPLKRVLESAELRPFAENDRLPLPDEAPSLSFSGNHPRIGGSPDAYPLYAAVVQALYTDLNAADVEKYVRCATEWEAYLALFSEEVDVIFVKEPPEAVFDEARRRGIDLAVVPVAREALVFFTHKDNPVDSLTWKQVQDIYSKIILNWSRVNGPDMPVIPFQQPERSTAQAMMLGEIMTDSTGIVVTMKPLEEPEDSMIGGKRVTASYRNLPGAIGYGLRWEVEELNADAGLKTLHIEGIPPSPEDIRDSSYPFTISLYAVSLEPPTPETEQLLDWLIGPEGKAFIEKVGYIPLGGKQIRSRPKKVFDNQRGFI